MIKLVQYAGIKVKYGMREEKAFGKIFRLSRQCT